jgi:hypothetical protein
MINDISKPSKQYKIAQIIGITVPSLFLAVGLVSPPDQLPHFQGIAKG